MLGMALLASALASAAPAAESCGPLRVGLREYPKLYQRDARGEYAGLDRDFFEALAQRSGCTIVIKVESHPRLWRDLRAGDIDLASWVIQNAERATFVHLLPLATTRMQAVTWRDAKVASQAEFLADARLKAIKIRQASYGPGYDELFRGLNQQGRVSEAADFDSALRAFTARRVSLIVTYPWSMLGQPESWLAQVRFADWHPEAGAVTMGLAISRRSVSEADAHRIEEAVRAMQRDGSLARMVARYLPTDIVRLVTPVK